MPKISIRYNGETYSCVTESSDGYISLGKDAEGNETVAEIHGIYLEELYKGELPENCQVIKRVFVILCGDLNVAHEEIDLKNPKTNRRKCRLHR